MDGGIGTHLPLLYTVYNEFISGAGPMANQAQILSEVKWLEGKDLTHGKSFNHYSSQPCKNLVLYMRWRYI